MKLNLDAAEYKRNYDANLYKLSDYFFNCVDSDKFQPTPINETIQWFTFLNIMGYTANITEKNNGLISSLLKVFAMFELRLNYDEKKLDFISIRCIHCKRETVSYLKNTTFDEMITKFMLDAIFHHVGMLWIISSNKEMKYKINENNHQDQLNKPPWYNISICLKLQGSMFETFITHSRTDRYNIMCYLVAHDKIQPDYEDDEISIGDRSVPKYPTKKSLKGLVATLNSIDICGKLFLDNNDAGCVGYINAIKEMFKKISQTMSKALTPKKSP